MALSGDAYHMTAPSEDGDGGCRVMDMAIRKAGIRPDEVDYINAHGTSTPYNDKLETLAIKRCFGDHAYKLAVSSTKSMTGHLLGGAGGLEAGITALAVHHQIAPPTINLENPDEECDLDYVPHKQPFDADPLRAVELVRLRRHQRLAAVQDDTKDRRDGLPIPVLDCRLAMHWQIQSAISDDYDRLPMKIAVCIKQVPTRDWQPRLNDARTWIREQDATYEMNEPDAYALEEALRLKEKHGGEVVVCSAGPARVAQVLREALARGADRAHSRRGRRARQRVMRSWSSAALAAAMKDEAFDLDSHRAAVRRPGLRADRRHPRRAARPQPRDDHHGSAGRRPARCASSASSKAAGSNGSPCRCRRC